MKAITNAFQRVGAACEPAATRWGRLLVLAVLLAGGVGTAGAREFSEPIRITFHNERYLGSDFLIANDPHGYYHLMYQIERESPEGENGITHYYFKIDPEGHGISDTLYPNFGGAWRTMAVDSSENVYFVTSERNLGYHFEAYNRQGDTLVAHHEIPELRNNWIGENVRNDFGRQPTLVYSPDESLVYCAFVLLNNGQENQEYLITYTRLTLEGEVIDSTIVLAAYTPWEGWPRRMRIEIDRENNLHYVCDLNSNEQYWTTLHKVGPDNEILMDRFIPTDYSGFSYMTFFQDVAIDNEQNIYLSIDDVDPPADHVQKINPDGRIEWDRLMWRPERSFNSGRLIIADGEIIAFSNSASFENHDLHGISFNSDGEILDSAFFVGREIAEYPWFQNEGRLQSFIPKYPPNSRSLEIYMVRELPMNVVDETEFIEPNSKSSFLLYPNPTNGKVNIMFDGNMYGNWEFLMFDPLGRVINQTMLSSSHQTGFYYSLDLQSPGQVALTSGAYYVILQSLATGRRYSGQVILVK